MKFQRIAIDTDQHQLAALVLAAERWLPQTAVNRTLVTVVAAMPTVATLYRKASTPLGRLLTYKAQGRKPPRGGRVRLQLSVPEAAAVMGYLGEALLDGNERLLLRGIRGSIHQQLVTYEGLAFSE